MPKAKQKSRSCSRIRGEIIIDNSTSSPPFHVYVATQCSPLRLINELPTSCHIGETDNSPVLPSNTSNGGSLEHHSFEGNQRQLSQRARTEAPNGRVSGKRPIKVPSKRTVQEWEEVLNERVRKIEEQKDALLREAIRERDYLRRHLEETRLEAQRDRQNIRKLIEDARQEREETRLEAQRDKEITRKLIEDAGQDRKAYLESLQQVVVSLTTRTPSRLSFENETMNTVLGLKPNVGTDNEGLQRDGNAIQLQAFTVLINALVNKRRSRKQPK